MKYLILFFVLLVAACTSEKFNHFVLKGSVPGAVDTVKVWLTPYGQPLKRLAEGKLINGKFELQGKVELPMYCSLIFNWENDKRLAEWREIELFVENGNLTFRTPHIDSLPRLSSGRNIMHEKNYEMTGSVAQDIFYAYQQRSIPLRVVIKELDKKFRATQDMDLYRKLEKAQKELDQMTWEVITSQKNLAVNLFLARELKKFPFTYDEKYLNRLEEVFAPYQDTCEVLRDFRQYLQDARKMIRGTKLIDVELSTLDEEKVSLLSCLNKNGYTVLDFWASWCAPCKACIPHLKRIQGQYKELKFISISCDVNRENWLKQVEKEQMPWLQLLGFTQEPGKPGSMEFIRFIPTIIVISPEQECVFFTDNSCALETFIETLGL